MTANTTETETRSVQGTDLAPTEDASVPSTVAQPDETAVPSTAVSDEQTGPESGTEPEGSEPPAASANAEAARYRTRLRETEAERDRLAAMVETLQRAEVARLASQHLAQGTDLLEYGMVGLDALIGEDGRVDPDQVGLATATLLAERPGLGKAPVPKGPTLGRHYTNMTGSRGGGPTWGDVLRS